MSLKTVILYGSSQKALETVVKKAVCLNLRKAAVKMADKAGCPVVPVAIAHSADVLAHHFPFIRRAAITIRFGEPIDLKSLPREQKKQAGAYTRTIIQAMLDDILRED